MPITDLPPSPGCQRAAAGELPPRTAGENTLVSHALSLAHTHGSDYATENAPRSPHPELSSNRIPGHTRLFWLKNRSKCNQFVGDALTLAGIEMPLYTMPDGSKHYVNAEALPRFTDYFRRVHSAEEIRPGDLLVLDGSSRTGENGAHVEIICSVRHRAREINSVGAHTNGAYEQTFINLLHGAAPVRDSRGVFFRADGMDVYILRPITSSSVGRYHRR